MNDYLKNNLTAVQSKHKTPAFQSINPLTVGPWITSPSNSLFFSCEDYLKSFRVNVWEPCGNNNTSNNMWCEQFKGRDLLVEEKKRKLNSLPTKGGGANNVTFHEGTIRQHFHLPGEQMLCIQEVLLALMTICSR